MRILLLTAALLTALAAPVQADPVKTHVVQVVGLQFKPEVLHIKQGDKVKWVFRGPGVHSVRKGLDPSKPCKSMNEPNSGPKRPGQTFTFKFTRAFDHIYHSDVDGDCYKGMMGKIVIDSEG